MSIFSRIINGITSPITGLVGSVFSGVMGSKAQRSANNTNIALQHQQQDWEERMSNSSWQRGTQDMLKAGLNPALAYSQGGASTPSVAPATVQPNNAWANAPKNMAAQAASALELKNMQLQNEKMKEDTRGVKLANDLQSWRMGAMGDKSYIEGQPSYYDRQENILALQEKLAKSDSEIRAIESQILRDTSAFKISSAKNAAELAQREVSLADMKKILMDLDIPEKRAMADWFNTVGEASPATKAVMSIGQWLKFIFGGK